MNDKTIYVVPARVGSKGLPYKNRKLIPMTLSALKDFDNVYITTDDEWIKEKYQKEYQIIDRPMELGSDQASMKDVLIHVKDVLKPSDDTLIVCLYPTYPERSGKDIERAIEFFKYMGGRSMLCSQKYEGVSPYLMMFPTWGYRGEQVINHNLYRRQDYPNVFVLSHFIVMMYADELPKLNLNLYNDKTIFMPIDDVIDVDTADDLMKVERKK